MERRLIATLEAFCKASRTTFAGSTIPSFTKLHISPLIPLYPKSFGFSTIFSKITSGTEPQFAAICLSGSQDAFIEYFSDLLKGSSLS